MVDRLRPFLLRLERCNLDDLGMVALPDPDHEARTALLARAAAVAGAAGPERLADLHATPLRIREHLLVAYSFRGYEPSWFGLIWPRSYGRIADRTRLFAAVHDAAIAAVVADLLTADDAAELAGPFELAASMRGTAPAASPWFGGSTRRRVSVGLMWVLFAGLTALDLVLAVLSLLADPSG